MRMKNIAREGWEGEEKKPSYSQNSLEKKNTIDTVKTWKEEEEEDEKSHRKEKELRKLFSV